MPLSIYVGSEEELRKLEELAASKTGCGRRAYPPTVAAALAGINETLLRQMVRDGTITPYSERAGNQPLYTMEVIEQIRESRKNRGF